MGYEWMGRVHAAIARRQALAGDAGQGTVEYVGVVLLVAVLIGAVAAAIGKDGGGIASAVTEKVQDAVSGLKKGS